MTLLEMAFTGAGGLEQLVGQTADGLESVLAEHALGWSDRYPITLRETLRLSLQQQIVAGHGCHDQAGAGTPRYRVWMLLPSDGLRGWTDGLARRILEGCQAPPAGRPRLALQTELVRHWGPCLRRAESLEAPGPR